MASLPHYGQNTERLVTGYGLPRPVTALWREIDWKERAHQPAALDAEALDTARPTVVLYPSLERLDDREQERVLLRALGKLVFDRLSPALRRRWDYKFSLPEPGHIEAFQSGLRKKPETFLQVVESSQDPVQRLVSIHLANALIANNMDPGDASRDLDVRKWPSTEDFANCKRYYSLIPLLGAYCPPAMIDDFGEAFAQMVTNRCESVYHTSVRGAFLALIIELLA